MKYAPGGTTSGRNRSFPRYVPTRTAIMLVGREGKSATMWHRIRVVLLSPRAIVVLALLFLVTDAPLSIFSTAG